MEKTAHRQVSELVAKSVTYILESMYMDTGFPPGRRATSRD